MGYEIDAVSRQDPVAVTPEQEPSTSLLFSKAVRASQLVQDYLKTGCNNLDAFLVGGIPTAGITEICGESSSGKTQLCLQLSIMSQLPLSCGGLASGTLFISTEQVFPSQRLIELLPHFCNKFHQLRSIASNPMDNIYVERIGDMEALLSCLQVQLQILLREKKIRLVLIDSLAALVRADYEMSDMNQRTADLRAVGTTLHEISQTACPRIAIVVVNQMTASFATGMNAPSMGRVWSNCVTTRLCLYREGGLRVMGVSFAPHLPPGFVPIKLDAGGSKQRKHQ